MNSIGFPSNAVRFIEPSVWLATFDSQSLTMRFIASDGRWAVRQQNGLIPVWWSRINESDAQIMCKDNVRLDIHWEYLDRPKESERTKRCQMENKKFPKSLKIFRQQNSHIIIIYFCWWIFIYASPLFSVLISFASNARRSNRLAENRSVTVKASHLNESSSF